MVNVDSRDSCLWPTVAVLNGKHKCIKPPSSSRVVYTQTDDGIKIDDVLLDLAKGEISRLRTKLQDKKIELRDSEQERENDSVIVPPLLNQYDKLEALISEAIGQGWSSPQVTADLWGNLASSDSLVVLRALKSCCLRIWVFESDFPQLEGSSSEYWVSLRKTLTIADGVVAARNLDLATRHAMIMDEDFISKFINPDAERLTIRYSDIMEPLFSQSPNNYVRKSWDVFSTWNADKEVWQERQGRLHMFRVALRTKAESTLNLKDYEMVTFPPDTPYDHDLMIVETYGRIDDEKNDGCVVKFCTQPAVFVQNKKRLADIGSTSELSSTSQNFVRNSARRKPGLKPSLKAVVITRKRKNDSHAPHAKNQIS
ncbi:hypothetical protein SBOR_7905 [Sclerotinia borealis F-4128]|uniref:Uncharacterized protein n=1 Tax=Sclerotinia borealis (strain F-4128) TaxID=1432307 RepID=W9CAX3_SCLBF|nr:hypothetical protein SBOR_7905 [Sclerotinia borealis F-4128]